jgi:hypothetical protein
MLASGYAPQELYFESIGIAREASFAYLRRRQAAALIVGLQGALRAHRTTSSSLNVGSVASGIAAGSAMNLDLCLTHMGTGECDGTERSDNSN